MTHTLAALERDVIGCRDCPRLVRWREDVAREKRAAFRAEDYWGAPVPGYGDHCARLLVLGLAPAAHGGNRTGRVFTGDRSGDFLFAGLHRAGFANRPVSLHRGDGLVLNDAYVTAAVKCAPPANRPLPAERDACLSRWGRAELAALSPHVAVVLCLGAFAWDAALRLLPGRARAERGQRPKFAHGAEWRGQESPVLLGCFHPSQQNTFTGRLTDAMLDAVLARARDLATQGRIGAPITRA